VSTPTIQTRPAVGPAPTQHPVVQQPLVAATAPADKAAAVEDKVKLIVLGAIMLAALAASFTHMHDWTMEWMPAGTPDWFGWANATISELVPLVATLSLRKRMHDGKSIWSYPLAILVAGAVLSLAAQLSAVGSDASWSGRFLACLPSIAFLFLSKLVIGDLDASRKAASGEDETRKKAAAQTARWTQQLGDARAETAAVRAELAETLARVQAETDRADAEAAARLEAETAAGRQAEILAGARAEIGRLQAEVRDAVEACETARRQAGEQTQAAGLAQGRLAEARETAERAVTAKAAAEERAEAHMRQVSAAAEQAEHQLRQQLAAATAQASAAERRVAELAEQVRTVQAQREEARAAAERQSTGRVIAEQQIAELQRGRDAALDELERVRRQLARASEKAETAVVRRPEISRAPVRKSAAVVPAGLAERLPVVVDSVAPETAAIVLVAWASNPEASQTRLSEITDISDRTIRKVLRAIPAEIAGEVARQVLALTDGRPA
jgi:hypothetical protein